MILLIMEKCSDLLPDYFSFVRGIVDTQDLPLNISRETLQEDKNIKLIAKSIENKISNKKVEIKNKLALNPSERRKTLNCKIKNEDKILCNNKRKNDKIKY